MVNNLTEIQFSNFKNCISQFCSNYGCDAGLFKLKWYNRLVEEIYKIDGHDLDIGICIIFNPKCFEKLIIPLSKLDDRKFMENPLDASRYFILKELTKLINQEFSIASNVKNSQIKFCSLHSFDLNPISRQPLVHMQTIGHVSGLAYYYHDSFNVFKCNEPNCEIENQKKHQTRNKSKCVSDFSSPK